MMPHFLYRHWDGDGRLLYVGISWNALNRTGEHAVSSPWFCEVRKITIEQFSSKAAAMAAEVAAVRDENPKHNRKLAGRGEVFNPASGKHIGLLSGDRISVRLAADVKEDLEQAAKVEGRSISSMVKMILQEELGMPGPRRRLEEQDGR